MHAIWIMIFLHLLLQNWGINESFVCTYINARLRPIGVGVVRPPKVKSLISFRCLDLAQLACDVRTANLDLRKRDKG